MILTRTPAAGVLQLVKKAPNHARRKQDLETGKKK